MRFVAMIFGAGVWCAATTVVAGHDATSDWSASVPGSSTYLVYADVVDVEPLVERHTITRPRQECSVVSYRSTSHSHPRQQHRHSDRADSRGSHASGAATVFGGLIGGLVGNQFGAGSGRKVLTVAGAILGASIANQVSRDRRDWSDSHGQRRCSTEFETREVEE
ncbi:MAG: glycine zipper 2TM domain-containing protein, partial [Gammaproteobacteria bacterium]|nr:glycine zipper 2TM domain-containing protein [Gammaproteobacteria bacterium]